MTERGSGASVVVALRDEHDIALARREVAKACDRLKAGALRKVRFITAVSEIVRNAVDHGGGGQIEIDVDQANKMITVRCTDTGPGIPDMDLAMKDGYSSARSMGKGLGGAKRLVDRFRIENRPEGGIEIWMSSRL
ncbi:ATP-binding protein [Profundibacterium mesophilum]|uniref:Two-component system OmpR family osmolarity sensor histidine kinase EnvZ n=1 Tax=Profundibacterium mesophilum KAUST100406-0324 TaxID=1037889 RepID=A0A921TDU1_9RHOB|nr:ATP-binding protein [Profundibacterium mesophilum]KAF0676681.1 two-component system OmpR family osmolarity sensor histidine kinase EnvZ [Profundibacterium mesophilum KAUST100406-0324]